MAQAEAFSKNLQEERSKLIEEMSNKQSGEFREKLDDYLKQIEDAKKKFEKWQGKGYKMFSIEGKKKVQVPIKKFNPDLEEILVIQTTRRG